MNSNLEAENQTKVEHGARRFWPLLVILVAALAYYGSYWHFWFNPHDEGGTACLVAQRLMQGELPWVDVEPGYNIGWFYPIVGLFHLTGVNYLAVRAWFFALSTLTALLGYGIVLRVSGSRWLALATGLALVVFPGSQFKNYIPLGEAANAACLIYFLHIPPMARGRRVIAAVLSGVVLGLTYLVRAELGYFFTVMWVLLLLVAFLDRRARLAAALAGFALATVGLVLGVGIVQAPAYLDFRGRGLDRQYVEEYTHWFSFLRASARQQFAQKTAPAQAPPVTEQKDTSQAAATAPPPGSAKAHITEAGDHSALAREPVSALFAKGWHARLLTFLTYAPLLGFAVFLVAGLAGMALLLFRREFTLESVPLQWFVLIGASLTTFPQYFFFRPDRPHISEFMPGYLIAMAASVWLLWPRGPVQGWLRRTVAVLVSLFLAGHVLGFAIFALQHPSAGTIAARFGRKVRFLGENGVHVRTTKHEANNLQGVHDAIVQHAGPKDYVICFPYMPGYNVMTNRPTYLRNVYVDNATRGDHWAEKTIHDFEEKRPAVVVIDDRAINGIPASKFSHWGAAVYAYLKKNYAVAGKFDTVQVFVEGAAAPVTPAATP